MTESHHAGLALHGSSPDAGGHVPSRLPPRAATTRRARWIALAVLALLLIGAAITVFMRIGQARALEASTAEQAKTYVTTVQAKPGQSALPLTLPGTLQGEIEAPIYPRASGYVLRWTKDLGARVKKGELLAEIDTPEIDQQLSQALAARDQLTATLALAKSSAERWQAMRLKDAVSQQELDERLSASTQAQANLAAAEANVHRLRDTQGFKRINAPFDGTITQRNVNVGDLVEAGNAARRPMFQLAQVDALRLYVYVPQAYAQGVKAGQAVSVGQAELPGARFDGRVVRTAGAIDTATRTMQVEIRLDNHDGRLLPGAYVQVSLPPDAARAAAALSIPVNTLLFRPEGPRVAVVDGNGRVALRPVVIVRDNGAAVEIGDGIGSQDRLVLNPPDSLNDGDAVTIAAPAADGAASAPSGAAAKAGA